MLTMQRDRKAHAQFYENQVIYQSRIKGGRSTQNQRKANIFSVGKQILLDLDTHEIKKMRVQQGFPSKPLS